MRRVLRHATGVGAVVLFGACCLPWVGLLANRVVGDMPLFHFYGERMANGQIPYRDFYFDWAPGSVPPVVAPAWIGSNYQEAFHALAYVYGVLAVGSLAGTLVLLGVSRRRLYAAVIAAALLPAALGAISINSVDYWPAVFTGAAIAALVAGRDKLGCGLPRGGHRRQGLSARPPPARIDLGLAPAGTPRGPSGVRSVRQPSSLSSPDRSSSSLRAASATARTSSSSAGCRWRASARPC